MPGKYRVYPGHMPKQKIAETEGFEITLTRSLIEQLDLLGLTGMYGSERSDVIAQLLSQEVRRLLTTGEYSNLRDRINEYPAKPTDNASKKETSRD